MCMTLRCNYILCPTVRVRWVRLRRRLRAEADDFTLTFACDVNVTSPVCVFTHIKRVVYVRRVRLWLRVCVIVYMYSTLTGHSD